MQNQTHEWFCLVKLELALVMVARTWEPGVFTRFYFVRLSTWRIYIKHLVEDCILLVCWRSVIEIFKNTGFHCVKACSSVHVKYIPYGLVILTGTVWLAIVTIIRSTTFQYNCNMSFYFIFKTTDLSYVFKVNSLMKWAVLKGDASMFTPFNGLDLHVQSLPSREKVNKSVNFKYIANMCQVFML